MVHHPSRSDLGVGLYRSHNGLDAFVQSCSNVVDCEKRFHSASLFEIGWLAVRPLLFEPNVHR